jgi:hypothetical protein
MPKRDPFKPIIYKRISDGKVYWRVAREDMSQKYMVDGKWRVPCEIFSDHPTRAEARNWLRKNRNELERNWYAKSA